MAVQPTNAAIAARDLAVVWHPCTQMHDHEWLPLVPIKQPEIKKTKPKEKGKEEKKEKEKVTL